MQEIVLYSRVSTLDQDFQSQVDDLKRWSKSNNFKVVESFGENVSGYDPNVELEEYDSMKEYVLKNNIKHIGIWEISRLSRTMIKTVTEIDFFTKNKINIHFRKENLETLSDNATNKLLLTILSSMAEMERNTFLERATRGRMSAAMKGRMIGYSCPPYGYTSDENGIIKVDEEEAKVIKLMFDLAIKGTTLYGIATHLNSLGIPSRWAKQGRIRTLPNGSQIKYIWRPKVIDQSLRRTLYKGIRIYKGINIIVPAIVSESDWNKVQERFKNHIGYVNRTKYDYLFKGKIRCGKCERTWVTYTYKKTNTGFYLCSGLNTMGFKCSNGNYINSALIDKYLLVGLFYHPSIIDTVLDDTMKESKNEELKRQIEFYKSEIEKAEAEKKRTVKMFTKGYLEESEFDKEQITIKNTIIYLKNKIRNNENELTYPDDVDINELLTSIYKSDDFNLKRDFVTKYVDKIIFNYIKETNIEWDKELRNNEKIMYARMWAFNYPEPIHIVMTSRTKQCKIYEIQNAVKFDDLKGSLTED